MLRQKWTRESIQGEGLNLSQRSRDIMSFDVTNSV